MNKLRTLLLGLLIIVLAGCGSPAATRAEITDTNWEETECFVELPNGVIKGRDITCGVVTAPAFHDQPERGTVRLALAIVHSTSENPAPDPLIMGMGGPGGSGLDAILPLVFKENGKALLAQRDVIVFEQRGVKYTEPHLTCPEVSVLPASYIGEDVPDDVQLAAFQACRDRFVADGVDLSAFNSVENASDIPFIIDTLGYEGQFNYYGLSYGTLLGQHLIRDHGDRLRSVILDGVAPIDMYLIADHAQAADELLKHLFESCAADPECSEEYPDLEALFLETAEKLNENPAMVTIEDPDGNEYEVPFSGDLFVYSMVLISYEPGGYAYLPLLLEQMATGNYEIPKILYEYSYWGEESLAPGMRDTIRCTEDWSFFGDEYDYSNLYPPVASVMGSDGGQPERCDIWDVEQLGIEVKEPVSTDIPTLFISGEFDPVTPRRYADQVEANFSNSYSYTFPGGAHGNFLNVECTDTIALDFLDDPTQEPDASCIDEIVVKFGPPSLLTIALTMAKANLPLTILGVVVLFAVIGGTSG